MVALEPDQDICLKLIQVNSFSYLTYSLCNVSCASMQKIKLKEIQAKNYDSIITLTMDIEMTCSQHGDISRCTDVPKFLDCFPGLESRAGIV